ncbi:carboxypeptidase-like regulatory domain-containing protein [Mucilaginibacter sp. PAMB04168]|uniref:carboxypeptidase-like regulatory domain-containing protein n=1 Tax=Mucilaginibacter sp. PAMB04168 TaxID=3138567 RepID=UPI0031F6164B
MRYIAVAFLFFLLPMLGLAQTGSITGKVINADTKNPLAKVSVFLSNATYGTTTAEDGTFMLRGVKPGQYELIITSVGYEDFSQSVLVGAEPVKIEAALKARVLELREVVVTTPADWKRNYQMFLTEFFGTSAYAKQCKISNPEELTLIYKKSKKTLEAYSYDFVNIENKALGYRIKFLLKSFKSDKINNIISWQGRILYEELPGSESQKKKWEIRRQDIYYGSNLHFFRSLVSGTYDKEGFVMRLLYRRPNTERPPEEVIQRKLDKFQMVNRDSMQYWLKLYNLPKYHETLYRQPVNPDQVIRNTDQKGLFAITFPGYLYVVYTKKREMQDFKDVYRPLDMENFETSIITLYKPYALFDSNGAVVSSQTTLYEGTWSKNKIAELLPVDYVPSASYTPPYLK